MDLKFHQKFTKSTKNIKILDMLPFIFIQKSSEMNLSFLKDTNQNFRFSPPPHNQKKNNGKKKKLSESIPFLAHPNKGETLVEEGNASAASSLLDRKRPAATSDQALASTSRRHHELPGETTYYQKVNAW